MKGNNLQGSPGDTINKVKSIQYALRSTLRFVGDPLVLPKEKMKGNNLQGSPRDTINKVCYQKQNRSTSIAVKKKCV